MLIGNVGLWDVVAVIFEGEVKIILVWSQYPLVTCISNAYLIGQRAASIQCQYCSSLWLK